VYHTSTAGQLGFEPYERGESYAYIEVELLETQAYIL